MENQKRHSRKLLSILLVLCMALTIVPITAFAAGVNYIDRISVTYTKPDYKAGDAPQAVASVTEGECSVAYEYWNEIEQKEEGSYWTSTGRYWYSDADKMASLADDKKITQFEAGKHYSYNIVLTADSGYFIGNDKTVVSVGGYEWGTPANSTNLEVKDMSTTLKIYSPYSIDIPDNSTDEVITTVDIGNVWKNLDASQPVAFTAEVNPNSECVNQMTLTDEYWQQVAIDGSRIAKTNPRNPIAGETYSYAVKLTAKDGYYFHDGFKGSGVGCTVICDGSTVTAFSGTLSNDRKQLTLWLNNIKVTAIDGSSQYSIGNVDIEGVTFNYEPGDAPKATARKIDPWAELYDIEYEYWEEMETNGEGESVPVKYWYSDESKNNALAQDKKITTFEEGKTYMYSISLKAKEGNIFATNGKVMVNGTNVNSANVTNTGTGLFVVAVRTIKPETVQLQNISVVEINNATISFNVGDKPVFTGKTPENVPYIYQSEFWSTDGGKKYYYSADFWNDNNPDDLFNEFERGKTYTYGIYFKAAEGYCFTSDTKLKINGKYYDYDTTDYDPMLQYPNGGYATMWVDTGLTMTPSASSHTHSYGADWKSDADNHWHECSCGSIADKAAHDMETKNAKDATVTEKGYTGDKVCKVCGYTVKGEEIPAVGTTKPANPTKPDENKDVTSPQTGDNSNLALWFAVLFISCGGVIGVTVYSKRRKLNKR